MGMRSPIGNAGGCSRRDVGCHWLKSERHQAVRRHERPRLPAAHLERPSGSHRHVVSTLRKLALIALRGVILVVGPSKPMPLEWTS